MPDYDQAAALLRETLGKLKLFLTQEGTPKLSEADTKAEFVERYVHALGFAGLEEIVREYYVKNSQEFIDYVLRVNGTPVLAIEAKPVQTDLTDKHAAQVIQYCAIEGIEWCVLTNARALWLFNTYLKGDQNQKLVVKIDLLGFNTDAEFGGIFEQVWLLSKASLSSPSAINSWMEQRRLDRGLRAILLSPNSEGVKALVADLRTTSGVVTTPDAVVQWARGQLNPALSVVAPPVPTPIYEPKEPAPGGGPAYWLFPCGRGNDGAQPEAQLRRWLDAGFWGFGTSTPGRTHLKPGDYVCFHLNKLGVAATARIAGPADTLVSEGEYPERVAMRNPVYKIPLKDIVWRAAPRPLTGQLRAKLDAFRGKNLSANPGWFVQTTRALSAHDFQLLAADAA
jgi:hypothetical protein